MYFRSIWMTFRPLKFSMSKNKFFIFFSDLHLCSSSGSLMFFPSLSCAGLPLFRPHSKSVTLCAISCPVKWLLASPSTPELCLHSSLPHFSHANPTRSAFSGRHVKYTIWFGIHGPYLFSASISPIPVTYVHTKSFHIPCQPLSGSPAFSTEQVLIHYLRLGKNMVFFGCVSLTPPTELVTVSP